MGEHVDHGRGVREFGGVGGKPAKARTTCLDGEHPKNDFFSVDPGIVVRFQVC